MGTPEATDQPDPAPRPSAPDAPGHQVELRGVTKRYGEATAVSGLDLDVAEREFLVLLGPSGCGKSTALRLIAGLDEPDAGTIAIAGHDVTDVEARDRDVSMVFQSYALYPHMTVRRNIEFPLRNRKVPKAERDELVTEAAGALGLTDLLERRPSQLSGGQRQRVALARAIVRRPALFLMDEPLSNLDAKLRVQTRAELIQLQRRLQTTVVYVTHDQVEAMTMGHRIAIMSAGVLQQVGPPGEVYARPANVFVAGFIGNPPMNLLDGTVEVLGDTLAVTVDGTQVVLPAALAARVVAAGVTEVVLGVRPEDLSVDPTASLRATVAVVESLGHERHLVGERADGSLITVRIQGDEPLPDVGHDVGLAVDARAVHVFDHTTGRRIGP